MLTRQAEQLAPGMLYGATASLAVLPLVAAAQSGTVPFRELATLLGSVGLNLLSTELYDWRNRSEQELDETLPTHLGLLAAQDAQWRDLLDEILKATQANAAAQAALGQAAAPYLAALHQDVQHLGSRLIVATVTGSKNVLIGDHSSMQVTENHFHGPQPPITFDDVLRTYLARERRLCDELPLAKPKPDARRTPRMQQVFVELRTTNPVDEQTWFDRLGVAPAKRAPARQALAQHAGANERLAPRRAATGRDSAPDLNWHSDLHRLDAEKLAAVAQTLGVAPEAIPAARHPLAPLEALRLLRRQGLPAHLVLLGDPGGGKSTWVRRLAGVLAWQWLHTHTEQVEPLTPEESAWLQAAQTAFDQPPAGLAPIRIAMHRWASLVRQGDLKLGGSAADLVAICAHTLQAAHPAEGISIRDHTLALLRHGEALILLDGLDEVVDDRLRAPMVAAVRAFAAESAFQRTPLLVTCRSKPYARLQQQGQEVLPPPHICTLGPLDDDAMHQFIDRWYAEMAWAERGDPATLQADARRLHAALPVREDLRRLAGTPLLLTMMARTNQESGLPDGRAELYENLVQELLWEWEVKHRSYGEGGATSAEPGADAAADPAARSLADILRAARPDLSRPHLEQALNQLAYAVHTGGEEPVEIERETLEFWLRRVLPHAADDARAKAAATELATEVVNFIGRRTGLLVEVDVDGGEGAAAGQRFRFTHRTFQEYLAARWIATGSFGARQTKIHEKLDDENWREAIFLALGCLVSSVNEAYDDALVIVERLLRKPPQVEREWARLHLVGEAFVRQFSPAKLALATDRTAGSETLTLVAARLRQAMQTPGRLPSDRLAAGLLLDDLRAQHGLDPEGLDDFIAVPNTRFFVARYPVTNGQFRRFVAAGGYGEQRAPRPPWWSEQGWAYRQRDDWTAPRFWDDRRFNRETQPVVGVSWYEAEAYCNWLNDPANRTLLPAGTRAQLPTRDQWMQAARNGATRVRTKEEDYPWQRRFDPSLANTKESNFGQPTPVDMYPGGATPAGVFDLAGNVWEYTADLDRDGDPYLKGGSWLYDAERAQASAADLRSVRNFRLDFGGFRVFCVHISALLPGSSLARPASIACRRFVAGRPRPT